MSQPIDIIFSPNYSDNNRLYSISIVSKLHTTKTFFNTPNLKMREKNHKLFQTVSKIVILAKPPKIYVNLICDSLILRSNLNYRNILPISVFFFFFLHFLTHTNPTILLDAMLQAVVFHISFFRCFFCVFMPSHNFNIINSFWITIIRMVIIKVNIIKVYTIKAYISAKECKKKSEFKSSNAI